MNKHYIFGLKDGKYLVESVVGENGEKPYNPGTKNVYTFVCQCDDAGSALMIQSALNRKDKHED